MKLHPRFPTQKKVPVQKPTLKEMVTFIEAYAKETEYPALSYNIEIKRNKAFDGIFHPDMKTFADVVCKEILDLGIARRATVQCFDIETLQYVHKVYPKLRLVLLIENMKPFLKNIEDLGFAPWAYSPYYKLVTKELIEYCDKENIKVIPWTVNDEKDIIAILELGVDGIISDFPDRVVEIIKAGE
jgi:glycerophosphoryl diester phosphodiesterase